MEKIIVHIKNKPDLTIKLPDGLMHWQICDEIDRIMNGNDNWDSYSTCDEIDRIMYGNDNWDSYSTN